MLMALRWVVAMRPRRATGTARVGDTLDASFRVAPSDLDMLMHMTNGRYLSILDAARISYMAQTGLWRRLRARGYHPVVVAQTISYRRPLTLGVRYRVHTTLIGFDTRNAYFDQTFRVGAITHAAAVVAVRYLDRDGGSVSPDQIRALGVDVAPPQPLPAWVVAWADSARSHSADLASVPPHPKGMQS